MTKQEFQEDLKKFGKENFKVEIVRDVIVQRPGEYILAATRDGQQWSTIGMNRREMELVAAELLDFLAKEVE
ncbi:hypothetical protein Rctr71_056 [Virus Rctr71]|nr:hypothetical protein Rctr71_056 [Virus Rctr71]